jgi:hypothetical protein
MPLEQAEKKLSEPVAPNKYKPTPGEVKATKTWFARSEEKAAAPRMKVTTNKAPN